MLLVFGIIILIGISVGGECLLNGREVGFKRCIFSLNFFKKLIIEIVVSVLLLMAVNYDYLVILNMTWYKLLIFVGISLAVVSVSVCLSLLKRRSGAEKILWMAIICLVCVISAEVFAFNSRAIQSHEYNTLDLNNFGKISASSSSAGGKYHINKGKVAVFESENILVDFQNLYLDISPLCECLIS